MYRFRINQRRFVCVIMVFLFFISSTGEIVQSHDIFSSHPGDCLYSIRSISTNQYPQLLSLDNVRLDVWDSKSELIFSESLTIFNTSGNLYYKNIMFIDEAGTSMLSVADGILFNKTVYWGSTFQLSISDPAETLMNQITISEESGMLDIKYPTPGDTLPSDLEIFGPIIIFGSVIIIFLFFAIIMSKKKKRRNHS